MEAKAHQECHGSLQDEALKNRCSDVLIIDSSSEAIAEEENLDAKDETPRNIGVIFLREGEEGQGRKRCEKTDGEENANVMSFLKKKKHANNLDDSTYESQEDDNMDGLHLQLNIESNFNLNLTTDPGNFDDDDPRHALDLNFHPSVYNAEASLNIEGFGNNYGGQLWEPSVPLMEKNNTHNDFHAAVTEDKDLDLELRLGVSSVEDPDLSLKL